MRILGSDGSKLMADVAAEQQAKRPVRKIVPVTVFVDPDKEPSWFWAMCCSALAIAMIFALFCVEG